MLSLVLSLVATAAAVPIPASGQSLERPPAPVEDGPCDPLDPHYCPYPFPSNFFTRRDRTTPTGLRVDFTPGNLPIDVEGQAIDPEKFNTMDGFPQIPAIGTLFPGLDIDASDLPRHWDIGHSLSTETPAILLLDLDDDEALAHWAELDVRTPGATPNEQTLVVWPSKALKFGHTYLVALRGLVTLDGEPVAVSPAFRALRDNVTSDDPTVEARRERYEELFARAAAKGFAREELQLAWDFTTASKTGVQTRLLSAHEDARARYPEGGRFTILSVLDNINDRIGRRISGTFEVPLYLTTGNPSSNLELVVDENDRAVNQGTTTARFSMIIPRSVTEGRFTGERKVCVFGHGLFQTGDAITAEAVMRVIDDEGYIVVATDFWGLSTQDLPPTLAMVAQDLSRANMIPDRSIQGHVNFQVLGRLVLSEAFRSNEYVQYRGGTVMSPDDPIWFGASLGGIYGSMFMALTSEYKRGILGVPGAPFAQMLPRSRDFLQFFDVLVERYPDPRDLFFLISAVQIIWDRSEISGFADHLSQDDGKRLQLLYALSDSQVNPLASNTMARTLDLVVFDNFVPIRANETVYGLRDAAGDVTDEDVAIVYDFGFPEQPIYNIPPERENNTHTTIFDQQTFIDRTAVLVDENINVKGCDGVCGFD